MTRLTRDRAAAFLDLEEGRGPVPVLDDAGIERVLRATRRIAVIGASANRARPSYGVFRYLVQQGFECVPINPNETDVLGVPAYPTLAAAVAETGRFDMVDVFRRSELCVPHARGGRCDRRARAVAPARDRQLGGGHDRPWGRPRGRDGSLHRDRMAADRRTLGRPSRAVGPDQRMRKPRKTRTTPTIAMPTPTCAWRRRIAIATEAPVVLSSRMPPRHAP